MNAPGIQARISAVEAGRLNHRAPMHRHKVSSAEWTRSEFCLWLSFPPTFPLNQTSHLCHSFPRIVFQQNVPMIAHSTPRGSPTSNRSTHRHQQRIAPILNSLLTYSHSTISTSSNFPILQYSADVIYTEPHNLPHHLHRPFPWQ